MTIIMTMYEALINRERDSERGTITCLLLLTRQDTLRPVTDMQQGRMDNQK